MCVSQGSSSQYFQAGRHLSFIASSRASLLLTACKTGSPSVAVQRRWYRNVAVDLPAPVAVGVCLEVPIPAGLSWWFSAAEYLNRVQTVKVV